MPRALSMAVLFAALIGCRREESCRGYDPCPWDRDLYKTDFPCCCGSTFVDAAVLAEAEARNYEDRDSGDCVLDSLICSADSGLKESVVCYD